MTPDRIISRAEILKRKNHRLSLGLRLKSVSEARKFIREHGMVLWNGKAELPNLLDASLGRIANDQERKMGKPAENCREWRHQILREPEFLDCPFFQKLPTVLHYDMWPYITVVSRRNRERATRELRLSREAKKLLVVLEGEGKMTVEALRKNVRLASSADGRVFKRALAELETSLVVVAREDQRAHGVPAPLVDLWDNSVPRSVLTRAEHMEPKDALLKLTQAAVNSCVLAPEKRIRKWFLWADEEARSEISEILKSKSFLRVEYRNDAWIISRKVLS